MRGEVGDDILRALRHESSLDDLGDRRRHSGPDDTGSEGERNKIGAPITDPGQFPVEDAGYLIFYGGVVAMVEVAMHNAVVELEGVLQGLAARIPSLPSNRAALALVY